MSKPDPTKAVLRYVKESIRYLNEKIDANSTHAQQLREAESKRLDANLDAIKATMDARDKTTIAAMDRLTDRVNAILLDQTQTHGSKGGVKEMIGYIIAVAAVVIAALTLIFHK